MPTAVCFGGGNGITKNLISGLKKDFRIVAATSMVDSGMATGQLRQDLGVLPPGDLVKQLAAVSEAPEWKISLWKKRFGREKFKAGHYGHTFGNLFVAGVEHITGSFLKALREAEIFLEIKNHRAYPATVDNINLFAELENGQVIVGEDEIDEPEIHNPELKIKRVFLEPRARAFKPLLKEISKADIIIFGPGDFYSSIIPCVLPDGLAGAIRRAKSKKIYIANTVTKEGETNDFSIENFTSELEKYLGCQLDYVIMQDPPVAQSVAEEWKKINPRILNPVKSREQLDSQKFIKADIILPEGKLGYDTQKIRKIIKKIVTK